MGGVENRLIQLTGASIPVGATRMPEEIADPSPPVPLPDGSLRIYGTASYCIDYASWGDFLAGRHGRKRRVPLYHPDGTPLRGHHRAWDIALHRWPGETICTRAR
jgi:hypothetical protein